MFYRLKSYTTQQSLRTGAVVQKDYHFDRGMTAGFNKTGRPAVSDVRMMICSNNSLSECNTINDLTFDQCSHCLVRKHGRIFRNIFTSNAVVQNILAYDTLFSSSRKPGDIEFINSKKHSAAAFDLVIFVLALQSCTF